MKEIVFFLRRPTAADKIFAKVQSKVVHKVTGYSFNYRELGSGLTCLSRMPVTLATNLVSFVMTFAGCHSPAVQSCVQARLRNIHTWTKVI